MLWSARWIKPVISFGEVCPVYKKMFETNGRVTRAELHVTAMGVYEAKLNGTRIGEYILAPGWTVYREELQYQAYDVTSGLGKTNRLDITVGKGWLRSRFPGWEGKRFPEKDAIPPGLIAQLEITYHDGRREVICTDGTWAVAESPVRFNDIFDGESYDATTAAADTAVEEFEGLGIDVLTPQYGEIIKEREQLKPLAYFVTPKGEHVLDFGQNLTGYVEFQVSAKAGDAVVLSHAEVLDAEGNFYNENYRSAKVKIEYICKDGEQSYKPAFTFMGFRYVRLDEFPGEVKPEDFTAIAVYSDIKRTGHLHCSSSLLNRLFENVIWGQRGNFLDVPTDCPQRDERIGWTGDAQIFVRAASYNYDVKSFFKKWLTALRQEQKKYGFIPNMVPSPVEGGDVSAGWGDAGVICPWQLYLTYGEEKILETQFDSMRMWIDYITSVTKDKFLWTGGKHCGDWLGLDAPAGSYKGSSDTDFIASAYYAYSTGLFVRSGRALGKDMSDYEELYDNIVKTFRTAFPVYHTQTEHVLALYFGLAEDNNSTADALAQMIAENGGCLTTGFIGTPYLLHALSENGHVETAYSLLFQEKYPSWLYSVKKGATTMWEHWDGIREDGSFWSTDMNSFNHYAYGAVADWVYSVAAGIKTEAERPGFAHITIEPMPDSRLEYLSASIDTKYGTVSSKWYFVGGKARYEIKTPSPSTIIIGGKQYEVPKGEYIF